MRAFLLVLALLVSTDRIQAREPVDSPFAGDVLITDKGVILRIGGFDRAWLNGPSLHVRAGNEEQVTLRVGDTFTIANGCAYFNKLPISSRTFESYYLDRIDHGVARFTRKTYSVRTEPTGREGVRIYPNTVIAIGACTIRSHAASDGGSGEFSGVAWKPTDGFRRLK
jgi:hypothetical protein